MELPEILELLSGQNNPFDDNIRVGNRNLKALRDLAVNLHERVKALESQAPVSRETVIDNTTISETKRKSGKISKVTG